MGSLSDGNLWPSAKLREKLVLTSWFKGTDDGDPLNLDKAVDRRNDGLSRDATRRRGAAGVCANLRGRTGNAEKAWPTGLNGWRRSVAPVA